MTTKSSKTPYLLRGQNLRSTGLFQMDTPQYGYRSPIFGSTKNCEEYIMYMDGKFGILDYLKYYGPTHLVFLDVKKNQIIWPII